MKRRAPSVHVDHLETRLTVRVQQNAIFIRFIPDQQVILPSRIGTCIVFVSQSERLGRRQYLSAREVLSTAHEDIFVETARVPIRRFLIRVVRRHRSEARFFHQLPKRLTRDGRCLALGEYHPDEASFRVDPDKGAIRSGMGKHFIGFANEPTEAVSFGCRARIDLRSSHF